MSNLTFFDKFWNIGNPCKYECFSWVKPPLFQLNLRVLSIILIRLCILIVLQNRCCGWSKKFLNLLFTNFIGCESFRVPCRILSITAASWVTTILWLLIRISFLNCGIVLHKIRTHLIIIDFNVDVINWGCTCFRVVRILSFLTYAKFWWLLYFLSAPWRIISYL